MAVDCDPDALLAASAKYRKITGSDVGAVIVYLLAQKAGKGDATVDELINLARCYNQCIPPGMMKSVEVALLCAATGGVTPCPPAIPCPPSGGCTYQDMQVAWTPTNLKAGECFGFMTFGDIPLSTLIFNGTTSIAGFDIESTSTLTSASFPNLVSIDPTSSQSGQFAFFSNTALVSISAPVLTNTGGNISIQGNTALLAFILPAFTTNIGGITCTGNTAMVTFSLPVFVGQVGAGIACNGNTLLTTVDLSSYLPWNGTNLNFGGAALSQASVDHILARCVASAGYVSGTVTLDGGTSSAPSSVAPGSNYDILINRGVLVLVNP